MTNHPNPNSAAQAATQHPIDEAIVILTEEADSLSECHTLKPGDWEGEPEAKARYDHVQAVVAALSKLRAPVADERAAVDPCGYVAVKVSAVDWLKDKFPALTIKAGLCERIGGRLYTITRLMRDHDAALASAPVAPAEVMDALNWVDDFIARCNRDDRGSCESVNVLRRALASAPVDDAGNWQQYRLRGSNETAEQIIERERMAYADLLQSVMDKRRERASDPVAGERCKRCGGPGWYTSHTTGYPESIPCSACNPQGFSVERLERDPFLAAQLWRKPVDFADAYKGAREDLAIWKRRALEAERDLRAERETSSRLVATLNADNGPTHMGEPAPQASAEDVRNAALEEAATVAENSYADAHIRIRALKQPQADKDGGQQRAAFDHPVFAFLLGEGPLHGVHFGDRHPSERGAYWWRKDLRAALSAPPGRTRRCA